MKVFLIYNDSGDVIDIVKDYDMVSYRERKFAEMRRKVDERLQKRETSYLTVKSPTMFNGGKDPIHTFGIEAIISTDGFELPIPVREELSWEQREFWDIHKS